MNEVTEFASTLFEINIFEDEKNYCSSVLCTKVCTALKSDGGTLQKFKELFQESIISIRDILTCRLFYGNSLLHYALLHDADSFMIEYLLHEYPQMLASRNIFQESAVEFGLKLLMSSHKTYEARCLRNHSRLWDRETDNLSLIFCGTKSDANDTSASCGLVARAYELMDLNEDILKMIFIKVRAMEFSYEDIMCNLYTSISCVIKASTEHGKEMALVENAAYCAVKSRAPLAILSHIVQSNPRQLTWADRNGNMPLHCALGKNLKHTTAYIRMLIGYTLVPILHENNNHMSPLRIALKTNGNSKVIKLLVSHHHDVVNLPRLNGYTELHKALVYPSIGQDEMIMIIDAASHHTLLNVDNVSMIPLSIAIVFLDRQLCLYGTAVIQRLASACRESVGTTDSDMYCTPMHHLLQSTCLFDSARNHEYESAKEIVHIFILAWPKILQAASSGNPTLSNYIDELTRTYVRSTRLHQIQRILFEYENEDTAGRTVCKDNMPTTANSFEI